MCRCGAGHRILSLKTGDCGQPIRSNDRLLRHPRPTHENCEEVACALDPEMPYLYWETLQETTIQCRRWWRNLRMELRCAVLCWSYWATDTWAKGKVREWGRLEREGAPRIHKLHLWADALVCRRYHPLFDWSEEYQLDCNRQLRPQNQALGSEDGPRTLAAKRRPCQEQNTWVIREIFWLERSGWWCVWGFYKKTEQSAVRPPESHPWNGLLRKA